MKRGIGFLMMILSLLVGFRPAIIVICFKLNQDTIEQKFCVNKNDIRLSCHGTCQLKKQLKETENTDSTLLKKYQRVDMFFHADLVRQPEVACIDIRPARSMYKEIMYTSPDLEVFRPPPIV